MRASKIIARVTAIHVCDETKNKMTKKKRDEKYPTPKSPDLFGPIQQPSKMGKFADVLTYEHFGARQMSFAVRGGKKVIPIHNFYMNQRFTIYFFHH